MSADRAWYHMKINYLKWLHRFVLSSTNSFNRKKIFQNSEYLFPHLFKTSRADAFNNVFLENKEDDQHRQQGDDRHREHRSPIGGAASI